MNTEGSIWGDNNIAKWLGWSRSTFLRAIEDKARFAWLRGAVRWCPDKGQRYIIPAEMDAALKSNPTIDLLEQ